MGLWNYRKNDFFRIWIWFCGIFIMFSQFYALRQSFLERFDCNAYDHVDIQYEIGGLAFTSQ